MRYFQKGLSLIELMVSVVIGLFLTLAVVETYSSSVAGFRLQHEQVRLQENARLAIAYMSRDIRQLGYRGCASDVLINNILHNGFGVWEPPNLIRPLEPSFNEHNNRLVIDKKALNQTSILRLRSVSNDEVCVVTDQQSDGFTCQASHSFKQGQPLLVSDCQQATIFRLTDDSDSRFIKHGKEVNDNNKFGNCSSDLTGSGEDCNTVVHSGGFGKGSTIRPVVYYRYFVANNVYEIPALYREELSLSEDKDGDPVLATVNVELVEGVENLRISYGIDDSGDGVVDRYEVEEQARQNANRDRIIVVKIELVMRSIEDGLIQEAQSLTVAGQVQSYQDGFLREKFSATVVLRNRI